MAAFLFKTEPSTYSWDDLVREKKTRWDGIKNAVALRHLRGAKKGDDVVIYHSGKEKSAIGLARVTRGAYADPEQDDPKLAVVDIAVGRPLASPVPLSAFKADAVLSKTELVRLPRLSVVPLTAPQLKRLLQLARG